MKQKNRERVAAVIDAAIDALTERGWHQGSYVPREATSTPVGALGVFQYLQEHPESPCCGAAALMYGAQGDFPLYDKASGHVRKFVPPTLDLDWTAAPRTRCSGCCSRRGQRCERHRDQGQPLPDREPAPGS
jgi:hypothetical protein